MRKYFSLYYWDDKWDDVKRFFRYKIMWNIKWKLRPKIRRRICDYAEKIIKHYDWDMARVGGIIQYYGECYEIVYIEEDTTPSGKDTITITAYKR